MARFSAAVKTGAGSTILPIISLFSSALNDVRLLELGVFNTTTTAFDLRLSRISSGPGTVGAALVKNCLDNPTLVPAGLGFTTHTAGTVTITDAGYHASIGAAIGAGMVWTFGGHGLVVDAAAGTVNGICAVVDNGTGQAAQAYLVWEE